jgi:hypothetical protein
MYYFDRVTLGPFNSSQPVGSWPLGGYNEFALHSWFRGQPGAVVYLTIYYDNLQAFSERLVLDAGGFYVGVKSYPVAGPTMSIVLYNPTSQMQAEFRVYASCCGEEDTPRMKKMRTKKLDIKVLTPKFVGEPKAAAKKPGARR